MKKKLKVLIVAFVGSKNLGDEIIFNCLVNRLQSMDLDIYALTNNPENTLNQGVNPVHSSRPVQIVRAILDADVVILGGGGLLQDATSIYNIPYFALPVLFSQFLNKKTFIISIGAGPITSHIGKWIVSRIVRRANLITTRDKYSMQLLLDLGANIERTHLVTDPAIDFKAYSPLGNINLEKIKHCKGYVVVSLRHWFDARNLIPVAMNQRLNHFLGKSFEYDLFLEKTANLMRYILDELELGLVFVSFFGLRDIEVAIEVSTYLNTADIMMVEKPINGREYVELVQNAEFVVAMRLHAAILATSQQCPVLAISYLGKVRQFMESLGLGDYALSLDELIAGDSRERVKRLYEHRHDLAHHIANAVIALRNLNNYNFSLIRDSLQ